MGPGEVISSGDALGKLGVIGLMGTIIVALSIVVVWLARDGRANSKEAATTYVALLKEGYTDAGRRKDLFDGIGKSIDGLVQAVRDLRSDLAVARQEIATLRDLVQRLRP